MNYNESGRQSSKRDLLDIMESYKYLNSYLLNEIPSDTRWDFATGWIELNMNREEWRSHSGEEEWRSHSGEEE